MSRRDSEDCGETAENNNHDTGLRAVWAGGNRTKWQNVF
jgi:hypothetical protein